MSPDQLEACIAIVTASNRKDLLQVARILREVSEEEAVSLIGRMMVLGMTAQQDLLHAKKASA